MSLFHLLKYKTNVTVRNKNVKNMRYKNSKIRAIKILNMAQIIYKYC